jgi:trehalose utilization protein
MRAFAYLPNRIDLIKPLVAACTAATSLGCAATGAEESLELGKSSEAIIDAQGEVYRASAFLSAIGMSRIYSSPTTVHYKVDGFDKGQCTGTLIDDHTLLTAGHCVCALSDSSCVDEYSGTKVRTDPRDHFRIYVRNIKSGEEVIHYIPLERWALKGKTSDDGAHVNDLALVRLAYSVPTSLAIPLPIGAWGPGDTADYGTFGFGPGPYKDPDILVKRVGLHSGTFTYSANANIEAGPVDSGGPTVANWAPLIGYLNTKIIAINSAVVDKKLLSANPGMHLQWIKDTRKDWDDAYGQPPPYPFVTYIGSNLPADLNQQKLSTSYRIDRTPNRGHFQIGGVGHVKGISVTDDPLVVFPLEGDYTTFHACVGLDDTQPNCVGKDEVNFTVRADGVLLAGPIKKSNGESATCFEVSVTNRNRLNLETDTHKPSCNYPAWVDAYLDNSAVRSAQGTSFGPLSGNVTWKNVVAAGASGAVLSRGPGWGWSAGASSVEEIVAGDGYMAFSTAETNRSKMAGLSQGDGDQGYGDIDYAIFLRDDGIVGIYEGGWDRGTFGSYEAGDVFRVEVSGGQVRYRKNGQVFYASATPPTYPLVLDTSLHHEGTTITNAFIESCTSGDTDCMLLEGWKNVGFAMSSGGSLTRTPGWGWSAGASSVEQIVTGNGFVQFSTDEANLAKMAGLSNGDGDRGYGDIDYAIFLRDDGMVGIYEGGLDQGTFGSYQAGDVFRVEVSGGQVRYRKNGQVFYASVTPPTYPLVLDTSLYSLGATITDAFVESCTSGDTSCMPPEFWKNVGYAMSSGGSLTRTPGWGWSAGASSVEQIVAGDGYAQFSTDEANLSKMAGLSHGDGDRGYGDIDYAIFLRDDGMVGIYEGGLDQGTFGSYQAGDVFRVEVSVGQVRYRKNGQVFYTSATPPTYPLVLDSSLYYGGATITDAVIESCASGDMDCIPAEFWKNVGYAISSGGALTRTPGWGWSAGASSVEEIAGDGYAQFSTDEANISKMAGLSHGDGDRGYVDIDYAIFLRDDGIVGIYEGGWDRGTFGSYQAGDVFRIEVSGGQVRYRRNGQVFYASPTPPTYPLVLDTSLYYGGATLTDAHVE